MQKQAIKTSAGVCHPSAVLLLGVFLLLTACATTPLESDTRDPLEGVNRKLYNFNDAIDTAILKPVTDQYVEVVHTAVRGSITNFFDNIGYLNDILNDFLQGKGRQGIYDLGRFVTNSTLGILGLFDPATGMGMPRNKEDFGQTLGVWGSGEGSYLVWPLYGPSTVRDTVGIPVAILTSGLYYISNPYVAVPLIVLSVIDARARVENAIRFRNEVALDPYLFTREAYRQNRTFLIHDGNPPLPSFEDELPEEEPDPSTPR
jgi:phospholipid-binding lipoprotein MlaA